MKIAIAVSSRNRPHWLRLFLLQMMNQTVRPDVVVIHENGQSQSMRELFDDIPIKTDFLFSPANLSTPGYAIPAFKKALEYGPDVLFQMCDDNIYSLTHIENMLESLKDGQYDVSYLLHCNILMNAYGEALEYHANINWGAFSLNKFGLDDAFALTNRAAHQYLAYLEFATEEHEKKKKACRLSLHPSDGVRYASLHPEDERYNYLRNVNFIQVGTTVTWVYHGDNDSVTSEQVRKQLMGDVCD